MFPRVGERTKRLMETVLGLKGGFDMQYQFHNANLNQILESKDALRSYVVVS